MRRPVGGRRASCARAGMRALVLAALCLSTRPAAAEDLFLVPVLGVSFGGGTSIFDPEKAAGRPKLAIGGGLLWLGEGVLGVDGEVAFIAGYFERDGALVTRSAVTTAIGSLVVSVPRRWVGWSLRPYGVAGAGLIRVTSRDVLGVLPVAENLRGLRFGGGAIGFFSDTVGMKLDLSYFRTVGGQGEVGGIAFGRARLTFWRGAAGLVLRF